MRNSNVLKVKAVRNISEDLPYEAIQTNPEKSVIDALYMLIVSLRKIAVCKGSEIILRSKAGQILKDLPETTVDTIVICTARASTTTMVPSKSTSLTNAVTMMVIFDAKESSPKRLKANHLEGECWSAESEEAWRYLEKSHVIQCGYSIQCNPHIPEEMYHHLGLDGHSVESPFSSCPEYIQNVFNSALVGGAMDSINGIEFSDEPCNFVKNFLASISLLLKKDLNKKLASSESYFNHAMVWPILELVADTAKGLSFFPGEFILAASPEECKADGVFIDNHGLKVPLLETSRAFRIKDVPRFA